VYFFATFSDFCQISQVCLVAAKT